MGSPPQSCRRIWHRRLRCGAALPDTCNTKSLILGGGRGRGWESKQIFTSCKVTLSTRHRQSQNHGEHRMETICRADLPGAVLPLKGAIAPAAPGGRRAGMRGYTWAPGTTTPPSVLPALARVTILPHGTKAGSSLDLIVPKELLERLTEFGCGTNKGWLSPSLYLSALRWFFYSFPFLNSSG